MGLSPLLPALFIHNYVFYTIAEKFGVWRRTKPPALFHFITESRLFIVHRKINLPFSTFAVKQWQTPWIAPWWTSPPVRCCGGSLKVGPPGASPVGSGHEEKTWISKRERERENDHCQSHLILGVLYVIANQPNASVIDLFDTPVWPRCPLWKPCFKVNLNPRLPKKSLSRLWN